MTNTADWNYTTPSKLLLSVSYTFCFHVSFYSSYLTQIQLEWSSQIPGRRVSRRVLCPWVNKHGVCITVIRLRVLSQLCALSSTHLSHISYRYKRFACDPQMRSHTLPPDPTAPIHQTFIDSVRGEADPVQTGSCALQLQPRSLGLHTAAPHRAEAWAIHQRFGRNERIPKVTDES